MKKVFALNPVETLPLDKFKGTKGLRQALGEQNANKLKAWLTLEESFMLIATHGLMALLTLENSAKKTGVHYLVQGVEGVKRKPAEQLECLKLLEAYGADFKSVYVYTEKASIPFSTLAFKLYCTNPCQAYSEMYLRCIPNHIAPAQPQQIEDFMAKNSQIAPSAAASIYTICPPHSEPTYINTLDTLKTALVENALFCPNSHVQYSYSWQDFELLGKRPSYDHDTGMHTLTIENQLKHVFNKLKYAKACINRLDDLIALGAKQKKQTYNDIEIVTQSYEEQRFPFVEQLASLDVQYRRVAAINVEILRKRQKGIMDPLPSITVMIGILSGTREGTLFYYTDDRKNPSKETFNLTSSLHFSKNSKTFQLEDPTSKDYAVKSSSSSSSSGGSKTQGIIVGKLGCLDSLLSFDTVRFQGKRRQANYQGTAT